MWLGALGRYIAATQKDELEAPKIGRANYFLAVNHPAFAMSTAEIIPLINDVPSFCAVAWRIARNAQVNPMFTTGFKVMIFGLYLPLFSKALLQDGQIYFL